MLCISPSTSFGIISVLDFSHLHTSIVVPPVVLCKSLMTYNRHLFIWLFIIYMYIISSLIMCMFRALAHFKLGYVFWLLNFKSSVNIWDTNSLSVVCFGNIFSRLWLIFSVTLSQFFHFNEVQLTNFSFMDYAFGIVSKKLSLSPRLLRFSPKFILRFYIEFYNPFWAHFYEREKICG